MKHLGAFKVRTKLISSFLIIALIVAIVGATGYFAICRMYEMQKEFIERRLPSVQSLLIISEAQTSINDSVNLILLNVINDKDYGIQLRNIDNAFKRIGNEWKAYTAMPAMAEEEKVQKEFILLWNVWEANIKNFVELANQYEMSQSEDIKKMMIVKNMSGYDRYYTNSKAQLEELVALNVEYTNTARVDAETIYNNISKLLISAILFGFLTAVLLGMFLSAAISKPVIAAASIIGEIAKGDLTVPIKKEKTTKEIKQMFFSLSRMVVELKELITKINMISRSLTSSSRQLAMTSEEASSASKDITTTINQLSEGTNDQAHEMQNISDNINHAGNEIENMSVNAVNVVKSSKKAFEASNNGLSISQNAVNKIKKIQNITIETVKAINHLGEESKQINEIVGVIQGISEQTNLLSLNAAIEAARAGEFGKGFSVVAGEVGKLAEQSNSYAQQITELVAKIYLEISRVTENMSVNTQEVDEGVVIINEAGNAFKSIVSEMEDIVIQVEHMNESIQSVAVSSKEIADSISGATAITEEIAVSVEEISASSKEQSSAILGVTSSAQELSKMAEELNSAVSKFKL